MTQMDKLTKRIKELDAQKKVMEIKIHSQFFKQAAEILGDNFSPSLALVLIQDGWEKKTLTKEELLKKAESFRTKSKPEKQQQAAA